MLLVSADDSAVPLFDTTTLHAMAAVDLALTMPAAEKRAAIEAIYRADRPTAEPITK